ncbi:TPA: transposase, partial [Candidatus Poribacteria bacterium]|nr:transposase [Candidatus Poribacteria bacterium]
LEELIPEGHLVRVVNKIIDGIEMDSFLENYKGGGTSSYHPKMMLKLIVYAYVDKIYTSRRIAKALRENVNYMWLGENNRPASCKVKC